MENIFEVQEGILLGKGADDIVEVAVKILDSKKASDIKVLKIDAKTVIADYFVICNGRSTTQIKSLADELEYKLRVAGVEYIRLEGSDSNDWKVLDCKDVIIHVFSPEAREFYNLDRLWSDCEEINLDEILNA